VTYNKHVGKTESPITIATDMFQSIQLALHNALSAKSLSDSLGTYGSLLDTKLEVLFSTHVQEPGDSLTDKQLTTFLMKVAEAVEYFLSKCPKKRLILQPHLPLHRRRLCKITIALRPCTKYMRPDHTRAVTVRGTSGAGP
jgi:hypothetical protein